MAQFGSLSGGEQTTFLASIEAKVREPTSVIWISGLGDLSEYVLSFNTAAAIESSHGRGNLNIGSASITVSNRDETFFSNGLSQIAENANIKIWAGFDRLNIPIFDGIVKTVGPVPRTDIVILRCVEKMSLFQELVVVGNQGSNNTLKLIIEDFCSDISAGSNISSTDETTETLTNPVFDEQTMLSALEKCCDSIFSVAFFDEVSILQLYEREYKNEVDWTFSTNNVIGAELLKPSRVINSVELEYVDNFLVKYSDSESINIYRERKEKLRILHINSIEIASQLTGADIESLDNALEGFKFTSAASVSSIDCIAVWMKSEDAAGTITLRIYSDSGGEPDVVLGISDVKQASDISIGFSRVLFFFSTPISIIGSTDYWGIVDSSGATGTLNFKTNLTEIDDLHTYDTAGVWTTEDDKQVVQKIMSSIQSQRVSEDMVEYFRNEKKELKFFAPAVPQLQLMDEILVDIDLPFEVIGRYKIVGRQHNMGPAGYTTIDRLEKT